MISASGLVDVEHDLNGEEKCLSPFKPGSFEEYNVLESGKVKLVQQTTFHKPGDRPGFKTYVPYENLIPNDHLSNIRTLLTAAVKKRLMADRRIGCLLSGGLDSSLIASLLVREANKADIPYKVQVRMTVSMNK